MKKLLPFLFPSVAMACPFCDAGGIDTAAFILVFFGLIALAAFFFFLLFLRRGELKNADRTEMSVLKAEGVLDERS